MSKIKNGGLDQYGAEPFEQQQFGTAGVERVKVSTVYKPASMKATAPQTKPHNQNTKQDSMMYLGEE